jgi:hypothetical protein
MDKHQQFVELELSGERLESLVAGLRDKLLGEFWAYVPDGIYRDQIKNRLEKNILAALNHHPNETKATGAAL